MTSRAWAFALSKSLAAVCRRRASGRGDAGGVKCVGGGVVVGLVDRRFVGLGEDDSLACHSEPASVRRATPLQGRPPPLTAFDADSAYAPDLVACCRRFARQ